MVPDSRIAIREPGRYFATTAPFAGADVANLGSWLPTFMPMARNKSLLHIGPGAHFLPWTLSSLCVGIILGSVYVFMGIDIVPYLFVELLFQVIIDMGRHDEVVVVECVIAARTIVRLFTAYQGAVVADFVRSTGR